MNRLIAIALAVGLLGLARPAVADPYAVQLDSATSSLSTSTGTAISPMKYYALQVKGQSVAASAWDVRLEGSLDGTNYSLIMAHQTGDGDGIVKVSTSPIIFPATWMRVRVSSVTLGSASKIRVIGVGVQ